MKRITLFSGFLFFALSGNTFAQQEAVPAVKVSTESPKNVTIEVESVQEKEKMSFDADITREEVIKKVFDGKSDADSLILDQKNLHKEHGTFTENSSVRIDLIQAGAYEKPPENYVYVYEVRDPSAYKGWELKVVNSQAEKVWVASGKSTPPDKFVWDGYDENKQWKAVIGEQYSFVFKALDKKEKKYVYWEEPFVVDSYIMDKGKGIIIRFSVDSVFDEKGLNFTEKGSMLLRKIFFKMKSVKYKKGVMEARSSNASLAKVQLDQVEKYARKNLVDMDILACDVSGIEKGSNYFEILLTLK